MHAVVGDLLDPHRAVGAGPDVQGQEGGGDPHGFQAGQHRFVEMQAGGWRSDGARLAGIDCLVTGFVGAFRRVFDVGRQRQLAVLFGQFPEIAGLGQFQHEEVAVGPGPAGHGDREGIGQKQFAALLRRLAGANLADGMRRIDDAFEHDLDLAAAFL